MLGDNKHLYFYIAIYIDRGYVNNKIIDIDNADKNRLKMSKRRGVNPIVDSIIYDDVAKIEKDKKYKAGVSITYPQYAKKKPT